MPTETNTADGVEANQLPEFNLFKIDWEINELDEDQYIFAETNEGQQVRSVLFDTVSKFNDRVYYLKRDGSTIARIDTMGTTSATYTPLIALTD
ncbi:hypothetical protein [Salinibaculum rarum]|uniref:hypothetical protein n=1 Tax=Salinibaculum rarum TaxID=3058903 RepID=UPI00265FA06F|nr:hypothetical protein [Salinibaculum sp. KK48]